MFLSFRTTLCSIRIPNGAPVYIPSTYISIHNLYFIVDTFCSTLSSVNLTFICPCITNIFTEYNQQDTMFHNFFICVRCSTCFRRFFRPSSGAENCTYSIRYLSDQYCYLLLATKLAAGSNILLVILCELSCILSVLFLQYKLFHYQHCFCVVSNISVITSWTMHNKSKHPMPIHRTQNYQVQLSSHLSSNAISTWTVRIKNCINTSSS